MAIDLTKTDPELGDNVRRVLTYAGVETPMHVIDMEDDMRRRTIEQSITLIMSALNLDLGDDSLKETPKRIAKMYLDELYVGLDYNKFPKITTIENKMKYETMLVERHIAVKSTCEHHFVAFMGEAFIAYIPDKKIIGLSKINRIVEFFSRRPQVQERLTEQIWHTLSYILGTENVAVLVKAEHFCVKLRGVEDVNSDTITSRLGGQFYNQETRNEFYQSIGLGSL